MAETTASTQSALALLRHCREALSGMGRGLSTVISSREQDFLALGESLMTLRSGCEDIANDAGALVALFSGQSVSETLEQLSGQLRSLIDRKAAAAQNKGLSDIDAVSRIVEELSAIIAAFAKIVKYLSMLGISTRIESARLGTDGRGFSTLADDVEKLAHSIVDHCAGITTRIAALRNHVDAARQRTLESIEAQQRCFSVVKDRLGASIDSLGVMAGHATSLSRNLSATAGDIAVDMAQMVQSLQSHDIVRQQIEHVEQALLELAETLEGEGSQEAPLELLGFAGDVLTLQISQIESAGHYFAKAATTLRDRLAALADRIFGIGQSIAAMPGHDAGSDDSPLDRVGAEVAAVKEELGTFTRQGEALGGIMNAVAETIADMGGSIAAIEEVGEEIELIALNASIKAAHTGEAGAALGVLASAIQGLSADARRQTDAVSKILKNISDGSNALQESSRQYNDQTEAWQVIEQLDHVLADLAASATQSEALFQALSTASTDVGKRAQTVGKTIDFDHALVGRLEDIHAVLADQARQALALAPEGGTGRGARLRALYDRYTMAAERTVHEAAFGGLAPTVQGPDTTTSDEASGEFGDNVELF